MGLEIVCLSDHLNLLDQCVDLLNEQWPRSRSARLRSLEQSKPDTYPMSLLLVKKCGSSELKVVGHSKILPVPYNSSSCFIESVVISQRLRGQGLGRLLMEGTEEFLKKKGITTVHLTTHDQQGFYGKLGYVISEPVVVYGGISPSLQKLMECNDRSRHQKSPDQQLSSAETERSKVATKTDVTSKLSAPAPPPPPPPAPAIIRLPDNALQKAYMVKHL